MAATLLGDFANLELTISADRAGLIQKVEISKPSQAKIFDEQTRAWVEKHWKMPTAQPSEPDSRLFIAPIVYPKAHFPAGGKYPAPEYPSNLIRDGIWGVVILEIEVAESGHVESTTVVRSSGSKALDDNTGDWVLKRWLFPPGKRVVIWRCEYQIR
jgi:TonB family protein